MDIIANDKLIKICAEFHTDEEIKVAKEIANWPKQSQKTATLLRE